MAIGWDEANPTDNAIVSQYPDNERSARGALASAWALEHDDNEGRHSFAVGNTAARDAITSWTSGALFINTSAGDGNTVIQVFVSSGQWEETGRFNSADEAKLDAVISMASATSAEMETGTETGMRAMNPALIRAAVSAGLPVATQAVMEAASDNTVAVTPSVAQNHPGVAKAWCRFDGTDADPITPAASYNIASIAKTGTGNYLITFTTHFTSGDYAMVASYEPDTVSGANSRQIYIDPATAPTVSAIRIFTMQESNNKVDFPIICLTFFGDQ